MDDLELWEELEQMKKAIIKEQANILSRHVIKTVTDEKGNILHRIYEEPYNKLRA